MGWDHELSAHRQVPVTLPVIELADVDLEKEAAEAQARILERRIIRTGRNAWEAIQKSESFEGWTAVAAALAVGRQFALRTIDPEAPWHQRRYGYTFYKWAEQHGFGSMRPSDRSYAIEIHENLKAITAWRATLPERERRRLISAQANVKRWHRDKRHRNGKCPTDLRRDANAAWKKFKWCVRCLPTHDRPPLLQMVLTEAAAMCGS